MIVSLKRNADAAAVRRELAQRGLWVSGLGQSDAGDALYYAIAPYSASADAAEIAKIDGILAVAAPKSEHPLVDRQGPVVDVGGVRVGEGALAWMCGPCSVESEAEVREMALVLSKLGVQFLRGGAYKPRTSPYSFQGHGRAALEWMRRAADEAGMKVVTEALSEADAQAVAEAADLIQVGSRNMQNFALLKAVGKQGKPVMLKRGMAATIDEWLLSGEYLLASGAPGVIFCERGIRGFDASTRNLLDIGAVALLAHVHKLPVIVDPSHASGRRDLVTALGRAALAAGAAGLLIETHSDPARALSDGPQAVPLADFGRTLAAITAGGAR